MSVGLRSNVSGAYHIVSTRQHISVAQTGDVQEVDSIQADTKAGMARELL